MGTPDYTFAKAQPSDIAMICRWLETPDVRDWFGLPPDADCVADDIANPLLDVRLVATDDTPFALVQDYPLHHWDQPHYTDLPQGGRGIACYIGEPSFYGQGHGSAFLRRRCADIIAAGTPIIAIDPEENNKRAVGAYRKAGFTNPQVRTDEDGHRVVVMTFQ